MRFLGGTLLYSCPKVFKVQWVKVRAQWGPHLLRPVFGKVVSKPRLGPPCTVGQGSILLEDIVSIWIVPIHPWLDFLAHNFSKHFYIDAYSCWNEDRWHLLPPDAMSPKTTTDAGCLVLLVYFTASATFLG